MYRLMCNTSSLHETEIFNIIVINTYNAPAFPNIIVLCFGLISKETACEQ